MSRDDTLESFTRATWGGFHGEVRLAWVEERAAILAALEGADRPPSEAKITAQTSVGSELWNVLGDPRNRHCGAAAGEVRQAPADETLERLQRPISLCGRNIAANRVAEYARRALRYEQGELTDTERARTAHEYLEGLARALEELPVAA